MELRQLRYFVAVAETRHFRRAAQRLHIAPPSLSQQIRALERNLRVNLLDRSARGVRLTPAGERLVEHARILLSRAERAREQVRSAGEQRAQLRVRVEPEARTVLGSVLTGMSDLAADLEIGVAPCPSGDATHAVRQDRADVAIVWPRAAEDGDLAGVTLMEVPVRLAVPAGHRFARAGTARVADLASETVVMFARYVAPGLWDRLVDHLVPTGEGRANPLLIEPNVHNGWQTTALGAVAAGYGVAPTLQPMVDAAEEGGTDGVVACALVPALTVPLELIWQEPAHPPVRTMIDTLTKVTAKAR